MISFKISFYIETGIKKKKVIGSGCVEDTEPVTDFAFEWFSFLADLEQIIYGAHTQYHFHPERSVSATFLCFV